MPKLATPTESVVAFQRSVVLPEAVPGAAEQRGEREGEEGEGPELRLADQANPEDDADRGQRVIRQDRRGLVHARSRRRCQRPTRITKAASTQWKKTGIVGPWMKKRASIAPR